MIVDDFDIERIAFAELETDAPTRIHCHCPLVFPVTLELVQTNALEWAQVVQALCDIQRQQQVDRDIVIQSTTLIGLLALPDLSRHCISP